MWKYIKYWLPTLVWMFVIFALSAQPAPVSHTTNLPYLMLRKFAHFTEYFIFTHLLVFSLKNTTQLPRKKLILLAVVISLAYAASDEFHQTFVAGRGGKFTDVLIDSVGIFTSALTVP